VDLIHTCDSDLIISMVAPSGRELVLANRRGALGANYTGTIFDIRAPQPISAGTAPFTGTFQPESDPDYDMARPPYGVWTLKIQDVAPGDTGTLLGWAVELETVTNQIPNRWNPQWTAAYLGEEVLTDAFLGPQQFGRCYLCYERTLRSFNRETNGFINSPIWSKSLSASISAAMLFPAAEDGNRDRLFVCSSDGYLSTILEDGTMAWNRDFRRPSCPLGDQLAVPPVVQLYATANADFRKAFANRGFEGEDVVFVATSYGCGNTSANRVYALPAPIGNASTAWSFNDDGLEMVDRPTGMTLDSRSNTLYVATIGALHVQPSLYALSTLDGSVKWAADAGPIYSPPVLAGNYLYVMTYRGILMSFDAADGHEVWSYTVTTNTTVSREIAYAPDYQLIIVVDNVGVVHGIVDLGGYPEIAWPDPSLSFGPTTPPRIATGTTKFYVGGTTRICQCDLFTGQSEVTIDLRGPNGNPGWINNLILDSNTGVVTNRLLITSTAGILARLYIPFDPVLQDGRSSGFTSSDLAIAQGDGVSTAVLGQPYSYNLNVTNNPGGFWDDFFPYVSGGDEVRPVRVTNTIPTGLSVDSVILSQGTYTLTDHKLIVNLDAMTNLATATIQVQTTATNIGTFTNVARVATSDPSYFEAQPANDVSVTPLTIVSPLLHIFSANEAVVLYWSTNLVGFNLESARDLSAPFWTPVEPVPVIVGDQKMVTNSPSLAMRFYRLRNP
jgi:hypothetical protein